MLDPASLVAALQQVVSPRDIKACLLLTPPPPGRLISYASSPPNAEDLVKVLLGVVAEAWREVRAETKRLDPERKDIGGLENELAMAESEVSLHTAIAPLLEFTPYISARQSSHPSPIFYDTRGNISWRKLHATRVYPSHCCIVSFSTPYTTRSRRSSGGRFGYKSRWA